ncbi:hypothetical protein [Natrialba chahannaoensis]|nr:hypothetical protein [Natrialba chahannaoensis]
MKRRNFAYGCGLLAVPNVLSGRSVDQITQEGEDHTETEKTETTHIIVNESSGTIEGEISFKRSEDSPEDAEEFVVDAEATERISANVSAEREYQMTIDGEIISTETTFTGSEAEATTKVPFKRTQSIAAAAEPVFVVVTHESVTIGRVQD